MTSASLAGLTLGQLWSGRSLNAAETGTRPNILYIMTDQQFAGAMSCAGNRDLKTPAMDSLAKQGVRFENAYCSDPLCVPSRTVMLTGRMPHETNVTLNVNTSFGLPEGTIMMGSILANAGYDCGYVGKWHLPTPPDRPDEGQLHGFSYMKNIKNNDVDPLIPDACVGFINQKRDRPFLLVASFVNPHDICEWARDPATAHRNGTIPDPPSPEECPELPANFEIPKYEPAVLRELQPLSPRVHPPVPGRWDEGKWRQYRWAYCRFVELVDKNIGTILGALRESGQEEDTVVIFSSDHGDGYAAHRWNQKWALYDEPSRVPFIICQKGVTPAGVVDRKHLVNAGLDLIPTMCDYAGSEMPTGLRGRSVRRLAEGRETGPWRDFVVSETYWGHVDVNGRMLRTERYKYIVYSRASLNSVEGLREQLFDMENDPGETKNLVVASEYRSILNEHRSLLAGWCHETSDQFNVPEAR